MTVIAYKNGVMAGDTLSAYDAVKNREFRKVARRRGFLFGIAGNDVPDIDEVVDWYFDGALDPLDPYRFDALIVGPDRVLQLWDHRGVRDVLKKPYWALGCGQKTALGVLWAGRSAVDAVKAAIEFEPDCDGRVIVRRLKG